MGRIHDKRFPGESDAYRGARDKLLAAEADLRGRIEEVAAMRRSLPVGGELREDYVFEEGARDPADRETVCKTPFSELFADGKDCLVIYSFMYVTDDEEPCPACTSVLDGLNGSAPHVMDRVNLAIIAKAPIQAIRSWAAKRDWRNLRLLSSGGNTYNADYFAETPDGGQIPAINVFRRTDGKVFHVYNAELLYVPSGDGQHPRHADMIWPVWNVMDLTPDGRGTDWFPKTSYE